MATAIIHLSRDYPGDFPNFADFDRSAPLIPNFLFFLNWALAEATISIPQLGYTCHQGGASGAV